VLQVGLQARHGTQIAVDKGNPPFLGGNIQDIQQLLHPAAYRHGKLQVGVPQGSLPSAAPGKVAIQPDIQMHFFFRTTTNR